MTPGSKSGDNGGDGGAEDLLRRHREVLPNWLALYYKEPIELVVENAHRFKTYSIDYHEGPRYPHLERVSEKPDLLGNILKARSVGPM